MRTFVCGLWAAALRRSLVPVTLTAWKSAALAFPVVKGEAQWNITVGLILEMIVEISSSEVILPA